MPLPIQKIYILELNQYIKSDKMLHVIYADIESIMKKIGNHKNNLTRVPYVERI